MLLNVLNDCVAMNTPAIPSKNITRDVKCDQFILRVQPIRCDVSQFIYFCKKLYMFQTGFSSIIRSSKLHIQCQVFVRPILPPAASLARLAAGSSIGLTNTWRCMCSFELLMMELAWLAAGSSIGLTNTWCCMCSFELLMIELAWLAAGSSIGLTNTWRCMCSFELLMMELAWLAAGSSIGLTNTWCCMCSFELLMMDGKPVWNM